MVSAIVAFDMGAQSESMANIFAVLSFANYGTLFKGVPCVYEISRKHLNKGAVRHLKQFSLRYLVRLLRDKTKDCIHRTIYVLWCQFLPQASKELIAIFR